MEDYVGSNDSFENKIHSLIESISQYRDKCKAEEENQSELSEKIKNLEEENRRLMEENKELSDKEVHRSMKAQMNTEWVKKVCPELEMKEHEIISLKAALHQVNDEVERLKSECCEFNTMKMEMTTELESIDEDMVALNKAVQKMADDCQHMEHELCLKESNHKDTVAQMEAEWEAVKKTLTTSHESALSHVCSQVQALQKDVELHERNAAEATKQLQEKDAIIHAMETKYEDLQKRYHTLNMTQENQQWQIDLLVMGNAELKEIALMTDKQKAKKKKEQDKAKKKNRKEDGVPGFLRKFFSLFPCCKV
ncbi:spindle pole body component 110-like [Gouania willdenowi]|uniref:spindle pole body component 110-like n=1 Tax=Gouania willdenowi TaxID=441366 RepID=UPI0010541511|nr:spindle pole body component 110-like [Gouania willdenowi]